MQEDALTQAIEPILADFGLELDSLSVTQMGPRFVLRVTVDGDGPEGKGPLLDDIAEASRAVSAALDEDPAAGDRAYTLELSSRGVSTPLTEAKHYRRNSGRLVKIWVGEDEITGRITEVEGDSVTLDIDGTPSEYSLGDIRKAVIQVEMNRKDN